jgi:hypothetical protein
MAGGAHALLLLQLGALLLPAVAPAAHSAHSAHQRTRRRGADLQWGSNIYKRVPACRRSGNGDFCSAGKTKAYVGPLESAQNIKDALSATAYNKEVIIFIEDRLQDAAHAIYRLRGEAGYGHVLPVMWDIAMCRTLERVFAPWNAEDGPLSCGAYARTSDR